MPSSGSGFIFCSGGLDAFCYRRVVDREQASIMAKCDSTCRDVVARRTSTIDQITNPNVTCGKRQVGGKDQGEEELKGNKNIVA